MNFKGRRLLLGACATLLVLSALACSLFASESQESRPAQPAIELPAPPGIAPQSGEPGYRPKTEGPAGERHAQLASVSHWFYFLDFEPDDDLLSQLVASSYDMVVIEPIVTDQENTDFPIVEWVEALHAAPQPKLVIAYIDIGQAEDWRTYWQPEWGIGEPEWIVGDDPDGWEGNYPVAFWHDVWRGIWLGGGGIMQTLLAAGFDGIYLDWVEAFSDENVLSAAEDAGIDPVRAMIEWVRDLASYGRAQDEGFLVIAQNAAELAEYDEYVAIIDAIAQEQTWFDGGADNHPPGDCPLPRSEADIDTQEYEESLSPACQRVYHEYPDSTLHVSSEWYLDFLRLAQNKGLVIFTVDYALEPENVTWVYATARALGFIPFVSERGLSIYLEPAP